MERFPARLAPSIDVIYIDTGERFSVSQEGRWPIWSYDGDHLYFFRDSRIYEVAIAFQPVFRVFDQSVVYEGKGEFVFDVFPDERGFLINEPAEVNSGRTSLIYNWFEELKRLAPPS